MGDVLVVSSRVKALVKKSDMRTSAEFVEALSEIVAAAVKQAVGKAKEDKRGTLKARDLEG